MASLLKPICTTRLPEEMAWSDGAGMSEEVTLGSELGLVDEEVVLVVEAEVVDDVDVLAVSMVVAPVLLLNVLVDEGNEVKEVMCSVSDVVSVDWGSFAVVNGGTTAYVDVDCGDDVDGFEVVLGGDV